MEFGLTRPCALCPFRADVRPFLRRAKAEEITAALEHRTFYCHETVFVAQKRDARGRFLPKVKQHCAGALVIMHKTDTQGDMQQIAERLGMYSRDDLRMDSPVYERFQAFIEAQER